MSARRPPRRPAADTPRLQDTVRLSADGLAKVLGDLEARVLRAVWELGAPAPARAVHERVAEEHPVAPLTVITVLNKLVDKRVLERHKEQDLYHYSARMTEAEFVAHASRRVVEGILSFQPEAVAASMVDVLAERDPQQLAELARLIRRRMREQGAEGAAPERSERAPSSRSRKKS
jgi:predicted transcriptional regulator